MDKRISTSSLLNMIKSFDIVQCQMHHEKVVTDVKDNPSFSMHNDKVVFNRVNLCEIKHRSKRLGCAHSKVNVDFEAILEDLKKILPQYSNQILVFKTKFRSVVNQIYALDHKVGDLEHDIAICKLKNDNNEKIRFLDLLQVSKEEHSLLLNQLALIKSNIKALILGNIN